MQLFGRYQPRNHKMLMRELVRFLPAVMTIGILAYAPGAACDDTDLAGTEWSSPSDTGCGIDIRFNRDGTAAVFETLLGVTHRDNAHWTVDGTEFHLTYDTWHGGIEGAFWQGGSIAGVVAESIEATETYPDVDSGADRTRACIFEKTE